MSRFSFFLPLAAAFILSLFPAAAEGTGASISPSLRFMMSHGPQSSPLKAPAERADGEEENEIHVPVILRVDSPEQQLPDFATELHRRGTIVLATVPYERLSELAGTHGIRRLESHACASPSLDHARTFCTLPQTVASLQDGTALDGTGVVVGFCDTGFDPNNPNFLAEDGTPRTVKLVNYTLEAPSPVVLESGSEISEWTTDNINEFHATHVAGILTGSYTADGMQGVAPGAEIVATTSPLYDTYLLAGCEEVIAYAKKVGRPAVVNISISSTLGPHDGTSLFNQYMDMLTDEAAVCISAGNDARRDGYVTNTTTEQSPCLRTYFRDYPDRYITELSGSVDVWSSGAEPFTLRILAQEAHGSHTITPIELPLDPAAGVYECVVCSDEYTDRFGSIPRVAMPAELEGYMHVACELNPENHRYMATITSSYHDRTAETQSEAHYLLGFEAVPPAVGTTLEAFATEGIYFTAHYDRSPGIVVPVNRQTINDFIFSPGAIGVGSMNTANSFSLLSGETLDYTAKLPIGDVSYFSSYGTAPDGTPLPTVCAPGAQLVSSFSSYFTEANPGYITRYGTIHHHANGRDYYWIPAQGTSMSSPFTAGVIALWLQAKPALNGKDVLRIIHDTNSIPTVNPDNPQWGRGLLDSYAGLEAARTTGLSPIALTPSEISYRQDGSTLIISHPTLPLTAVRLLSPDGTLALIHTSGTTSSHSASGASSQSASGADVCLESSTLTPGIYLLVATDSHGATHTLKVAIRH